MNLAKKICFKPIPVDFTLKSTTKILEFSKQIDEEEANIYCDEYKKPHLFETTRLIIRHFSPEDNRKLHVLANDKETSPIKYLDHTWPTDLDNCTKMVQDFSINPMLWGVFIKPSMELIGMITFNKMDEGGLVDLGHIWHTSYLDHDYNTEAISLMVQYAFDTLNANGIYANNPINYEAQLAPLKKIGMELRNRFRSSFINDETEAPIGFDGCRMELSKDMWDKINHLESSIPEDVPQTYSPKSKPVIVSLAQEMRNLRNSKEAFIENINEFCSIVDREETKIVGVKIPFSSESKGWSMDCGTNTDKAIAQKYITNGTIKLFSNILNIENPEIIGIRTNITGAGNFDFIIGVVVESFNNLPEHLPENSVTVVCPPCRFAKMEINEKKLTNRTGYDERMLADEYFINEFRQATKYVYNKDSYPFNTYDETGDILTKYEPVKIPVYEYEKYESFVFNIVSLPDILCACSMTPPDSEEFVIFKYFEIQNQVLSLECAKMYNNEDYYGFPSNSDIEGKYNSCFGSRVSSFEGLPDCVEKMTIKGGIYVHISQLEFNGDNPSMPYDIALNHLDEFFFNNNHKYERDWSKHIISRFRQANAASVFVPIKLRT